MVKPTGFLHNHKNYPSPVNLIVCYFSLITQTKEKLSDTINTGFQKTAFNITRKCLLLHKFIK